MRRFLVILVAFTFLPATNFGTNYRSLLSSGYYHFVETTGNDTINIEWKFEALQGMQKPHDSHSDTAGSYKMQVVRRGMRVKMQFDEGYSIIHLDHFDAQGNPMYAADRKGSQIFIEPTGKSSIKSQIVSIDTLPWFQQIPYSLGQAAILNISQPISFWVLHPTKLTPVKLLSEFDKFDTLMIDGKPVRTIKRIVHPTGWMQPLWHGNYWFRQSDGLFMKYSGVNGVPGTPETTILWTPK